jgi:hypothetical protein
MNIDDIGFTQFIVYGLGTIVYIAVGLLLISWWRHRLEARRQAAKQAEDRVQNALVEGILKNLICTVEDAEDVYVAEWGAEYFLFSRASGLDQALRKAKVALISSGGNANDLTKAITTLNRLLQDSKQATSAKQRKSPLANVPSPERELLEDLRQQVSDPNSDYVADKLEKLGGAIRERRRVVDKISGDLATQSIYTRISLGVTLAMAGWSLLAYYLL